MAKATLTKKTVTKSAKRLKGAKKVFCSSEVPHANGDLTLPISVTISKDPSVRDLTRVSQKNFVPLENKSNKQQHTKSST